MIMLPAFHHKHISDSVEVISEETNRALDKLEPGAHVDLYAWTRRLALRVAMRALFGLDPDGELARSVDAAGLFEQGLSFYSSEYLLRILRTPFSPWARMQQAARKLDVIIYGEISRRRATGRRGSDILSLLLDAEDEDGSRLSDRQIRDEVMTLLFAGHDTTTSTISFMFYELARHPAVVERLLAEQDEQISAGGPTAAQLTSGELEQLEMVLDETLRLYPPAWIGARKSRETFEFAGTTVPGGAYVNYSSWVSHHLPHVFDEPNEFRPERFAPDAKAALPKGAYIPFGGGSRICIGMRFGQLEVKAIANALLERFDFELEPGYKLRTRQMPTIGPRDGVPLIIHPRSGARSARFAHSPAAR